VIPMPTDLRSNIDVFELQEQKSGRKGLAKLTVNVPTSSHRDSSDRPPRWSTPEFIFYYLVAVIVIPMMTWVPISLSSRAFDSFALEALSHTNALLSLASKLSYVSSEIISWMDVRS
jgi:hypothetical protein